MERGKSVLLSKSLSNYFRYLEENLFFGIYPQISDYEKLRSCFIEELASYCYFKILKGYVFKMTVGSSGISEFDLSVLMEDENGVEQWVDVEDRLSTHEYYEYVYGDQVLVGRFFK